MYFMKYQCELKDDDQLKYYFEREILKMEPALLSLNLSKPALRSLVRLNIYSINDLRGFDVIVLKNAHGLGKTTIEKLNPWLRTKID